MAIQFPIEVNSIDLDDKVVDERVSFGSNQGDLVTVRPCGKEYNDKMYLGFLLGEISIQPRVCYNKEKKSLSFTHTKNPAIFVPELGKIIYGVESWWSKIHSEDELKDITDYDISNFWYVKLWKSMQEKKESE